MAVSMGDELRVRCYVCGRPVARNERIALFAMSHDTDRVFIVHGERCAQRLERDGLVLLVKVVARR